MRALRTFSVATSCPLVGEYGDGHPNSPVFEDAQVALSSRLDVIRLTSENVRKLKPQDARAPQTILPPNGGWEYRVGPGDFPGIIVFDRRTKIDQAAQSEGRSAMVPLTEVPLTLLDEVNAGVGLSADAGASRVTVFRTDRACTVKLVQHLGDGRPGDNPTLPSGDLVTVSLGRSPEVFPCGELRSRPAIRLEEMPVSVIQAIARRGGLADLRADARGIFVLRRDGDRTVVFQPAPETPFGPLAGSQFILVPDEVNSGDPLAAAALE